MIMSLEQQSWNRVLINICRSQNFPKPRFKIGDQVVRRVTLENGSEVKDHGWVVGYSLDSWHIGSLGWEYQVGWVKLPSEDFVLSQAHPVPWIEAEFEFNLDKPNFSPLENPREELLAKC